MVLKGNGKVVENFEFFASLCTFYFTEMHPLLGWKK